jgi:hypothetical protein
MVPYKLLVTDISNVLKYDSYYLLHKVTSYVAESLLRYLEDQEMLLLYQNMTVISATLSGK